MNNCYTCKHSGAVNDTCAECIVDRTGGYSMREAMPLAQMTCGNDCCFWASGKCYADPVDRKRGQNSPVCQLRKDNEIYARLDKRTE